MEQRLTNSAYLCGDEPTIADISAACELDSSRYVELDLVNFPKTKAWLYRMIDEDPIMMELSVPTRKVANIFVNKAKEEGTFTKLDLSPSMEYGYKKKGQPKL